MKIRWIRGICTAVIIAAVTAGISYQILNADKKSEKLNAVLVMAYMD